MNPYDHKTIEKKWQEQWEADGIYKTADHASSAGKPKQFVLDMFPYPSGDGLHVGHPRGYMATDVYSRMKRMQGFNVLHPMGWDAFGLPAENYAIKHKIHPRAAVEENITRFKKQLGLMGVDYDWSREINTTDPAFYKWTQWIFLQMYHKGLAYESWEPINWCPGCQTGLANEDVENDGTCERCGSKVEKKPMRQWVLKITDYADRMLADLDKLPKWPEGVKEAQRNWIGKSEGAEIDFKIRTNPSPALPQGKGAAPGYLTTDAKNYSKLKEKALEMRENPTSGEALLWEKLKGDQLQNHFRQQHIVGPFIADFVCLKKMLIIEVDGDVHDNLEERDQERTNILESLGYHVVRFSNDEVINDTLKVLERISDELARLPSLGEGLGMGCSEETDSIKVFTTRADTLFGVTYVVLAPEHPLIQTLDTKIQNYEDVVNYIASVKDKSDIDRTNAKKEKTGVELKGVFAINPANNEHVPVWVADYVLANHGTGAVMAVPAHDERDFEFAKKYELPSKKVIYINVSNQGKSQPGSVNEYIDIYAMAPTDTPISYDCWPGYGVLTNSGKFDEMTSEEAQKAITEFVGGKMVSKYKLKDWVFSRQRYWGEPIPIIHCEKCGVVPVPEKDLPVTLPEVESYAPTGTGESPLANIESWVNVPCPKCNEMAKRETNTMPQWAGSSWYYLRYIDPKNDSILVDKDKEKKWMDVDVYVGGDHATRHLIYARFWHKFLFDMGAVSTEEPFPRLEFLGFILAENGQKMSKSKGNVVTPDDVIAQFGADAFRLYQMFIGPFEQTAMWNANGMVGTLRFVEKVWRIAGKVSDTTSDLEVQKILNKTIKQVSEQIESFKFNTAVSAFMILANAMDTATSVSKDDFKKFLQILAPFAPHVTEELWNSPLLAGEGENQGFSGVRSIHLSSWPTIDEQLIAEETVVIGIQVNGKVRAEIELAHDASEGEVKEKVMNVPEVIKWIDGKDVKKFIFIPKKIISIVV